jgi:hypothetical protein
MVMIVKYALIGKDVVLISRTIQIRKDVADGKKNIIN